MYNGPQNSEQKAESDYDNFQQLAMCYRNNDRSLQFPPT